MWNQELLKTALDFAARAHGEQRVPGTGFPYVVHVVKVATEVLVAGEGEPAAAVDLALACALLHDTVEDAGVPVEVLRRNFGDAVAAGVSALSKDESLPKGERMADSLRRIQAQPRPVWWVKLADRITNLEPPPPGWALEKRRAYLAEARTIHQALASSSAALGRRLELKIAEYRVHCAASGTV
jgi:guanosine-3',5'-bis(diphosphate) 3'-pyrophosphohydrolase